MAFTAIGTGEKTKRPYYDGLTFHRVIKDLMIQDIKILSNPPVP